ncbi:MAG: S10 family peptidase [Acidobacteriota bacterium]
MRTPSWLLIVPLLSSVVLAAPPQAAKSDKDKDRDAKAKVEEPKPEEQVTKGSVTVGGRRIDYTAIAGTLVVCPKEPEDTPPDDKAPPPPPTAVMSYVAYLAGDGRDTTRPITFVYNGGPGSASFWLHMGAFGPRRVVTADDSHGPAAPYKLVDNQYSLLDASDLVFIDAPGTGFGKILGKDKEKAFYSVDGDAAAFAEFITQFLSKQGRWNSPKYLFGESYGTTRSAVLAFQLATRKSVELNGVILLSQILAFDNSADDAESNPSIDLPYELVLPTYAATAWYHKKLPERPASLETLVAEVEQFAMTDYAVALDAGSTLDPARRKAVLDKLHRYTGLPVAYLDKANLRVDGGEFEKMLQDDAGLTTGRLDSRFSGPHLDPLSKESEYDPQAASIRGPYVAAYNDYVRKTLKFGGTRPYKPMEPLFMHWEWTHHAPGTDGAIAHGVNVMPDLAATMKLDPNLRVQLNAGYYDIATPFFEGIYELHHLQIPLKLQGNIEVKLYPSGHMVYANEPSLKALHDNVAAFIRRGVKAR